MADIGLPATTPTADGGVASATPGGVLTARATPEGSTGVAVAPSPPRAAKVNKEDDDGTDTDDDGQLIQKAEKIAEATKQVKRPPPKRPAGAITLRTLLDEGLLSPGPDALSMEYKGSMTFATLTEDGRILWEGMSFDSPSAFTIYIKRQTNPKRKADDGWKTLKYGGKFLEAYKVELMMRRYNEEGGHDAGEGGPALPLKRPRSENGPVLKQLAPRVRGGARGGAAAGAGAGGGGGAAAGEAAAAGGAPSPSRAAAANGGAPAAAPGAGGGGPSATAAAAPPAAAAAGARTVQLKDSTPRPDQLASQPVQQHDFAPGAGAVVPAAQDPVLLQQGAAASAGRYFVTGAELDLGVATSLQQQQQEGGSGSGSGGSGEAGGAAGRPRRAVRAPERLIDALSEKGPYDMVRCGTYTGRPGSGTTGSQPFQVLVSPCAEVVMDFHAHLDTHEVIGLLAGTWHPEQRLLLVQRAFPVREALPSSSSGGSSRRGADDPGEAGTDHINVEMDSEDQFKVTEVIQQLYGMQVVGWYHSHPTFCPLPSSIDIGNQLMMQRNAAAGGGAEAGSEPYIGAILSPYDPRLPEPQSAVTWFHVRQEGGKATSRDRDLLEQVGSPMELQVDRLITSDTPQQLLTLNSQLALTGARYVLKRSAVNLAGNWRGSPTSKLQKLLASVTSWLPSSSFTPQMRQQYSQQVLQAVQGARQAAGLPQLPLSVGPQGATTSAAAAAAGGGLATGQAPASHPAAAVPAPSVFQQQGGLLLSPAVGSTAAPSEPTLPGLELPEQSSLGGFMPSLPEPWPGSSNGSLGMYG